MEGPQTSQPQIVADILTPSPNRHATNTVPSESKGRESEWIRHEQNREENTTPGELVEEHKELAVK